MRIIKITMIRAFGLLLWTVTLDSLWMFQPFEELKNGIEIWRVHTAIYW